MVDFGAGDVPRDAELFFDYRYLEEAETAGQCKKAVLVDWMADGAAASSLSRGRGAKVLSKAAGRDLAPGKKKRKGKRKADDEDDEDYH